MRKSNIIIYKIVHIMHVNCFDLLLVHLSLLSFVNPIKFIIQLITYSYFQTPASLKVGPCTAILFQFVSKIEWLMRTINTFKKTYGYKYMYSLSFCHRFINLIVKVVCLNFTFILKKKICLLFILSYCVCIKHVIISY